jgi:osmotically-inducible protein OsmY
MITLLKKYDDKLLAQQAERALANDPSIDNSRISVSSKNGIITLEGNIRNQSEHRRAVDIVQRSLKSMNMKYDRIADKIIES